MAAQDYYFSSKSMPTLGRMWILKMLQDVSGSGGGLSMLGSVVQEASERGGFLGLAVSHYPIPMLMSQPGIVTRALAGIRPELGLAPDDPIVLVQALTIANQTIMINRKDAFATGVGPLPALPATFGLDVDYGKMVSATINFGTTAELRYIPLGYLGGLYRHVNGTATAVDPTGVLEDNYVVDSVLLTHDVEVSFTSAERFTGDFDAKLTALGSIPAGNLKVIYRRMDDRTIVAKVRGEKAWLAAFSVSEWHDLNMT